MTRHKQPERLRISVAKIGTQTIRSLTIHLQERVVRVPLSQVHEIDYATNCVVVTPWIAKKERLL
jgi:hypothetical protein